MGKTKITIAQALSTAADTVYLKKRAPPDAPTGYYDCLQPYFIKTVKAKGVYRPNFRDVNAFLDAAGHPTAIDDRKGAFATALGILARLDPDSDLQKKLNDNMINVLYNTIPHPSAAFLGPEHCFRQADGSGNNLLNPDYGRAGTPYARSVQAKSGLPHSSLPDAGLIFDSILSRKGIVNHEGGMSSLIFAFASIVTHSLFRTDSMNIHINNASSYLDLSPLYGDSQAAQDKVRDRTSGRGLLYPDTFSEDRFLFLTPATSVLLVLFSRNHNYIANKILKINERKRWSDPPPSDPAKRARQDEEIFQTARLVNCGHFVNTVMGDYVAGFLGSSEGLNWNMQAFDWHATVSARDQKWTEDMLRSIFGDKPFNQLTLADLPTVAKVFQYITPNPAERTFAGSSFFSSESFVVLIDFFSLKRGPGGRFSDDDLADILHTATEIPAGAFRGRGTPEVLRLVEIMGIEQSRAWGVCTMNEFRKFLGLKPFKRFEDWNPDPEIAACTSCSIIEDHSNIFYRVLLANSMAMLTISNSTPVFKQKPRCLLLMDLALLAVTRSITRGILGDAIALVRGDRFYTSDFTPINLTTWGFHDCQRDMDNGAQGAMSMSWDLLSSLTLMLYAVPKLLLRHLPRHFPWVGTVQFYRKPIPLIHLKNSVYSLYPFFTPHTMKDSLTKQGIAGKYTFDRPATLPVPKVLNTLAGIKTVWSDPKRFKVIYEKAEYGSGLVFDDPQQQNADMTMVVHALFPDKESSNHHAAWISTSVKAKIQEKSWKYNNVAGNYVDIVKDVINAVAIHFTAEKIAGISVKTKYNPSGIYTENELFDMLATLSTFVNIILCHLPLNVDNIIRITFLMFDQPENSFALHEAALSAGANIRAIAMKSLIKVIPSSAPGFLRKISSAVTSLFRSPKDAPWYPFMNRLATTGRPTDELFGNVIDIAVSTSVNWAHSAVNVIDFYLDDVRAKERQHIIELINNKGFDSDTLLHGYVCEAQEIGLKPQFSGLWRQAVVDTVIDQGPGLPPLEVKAGDWIRGSFRNAHLDPLAFPDPATVNPNRPAAAWNNLNGTGFDIYPGVSYCVLTITEIVKAVFSLKNVRRAPGNAGIMRGFAEIVHETETDFFIQRNGTVGMWPGSLNILYDD
ncbi:hypothetical protein C0995_002017 [Termitomyces sp. Mi166|nr:hypothetical protein C0995_002017 [Termitomyces sp. Mi166\